MSGPDLALLLLALLLLLLGLASALVYNKLVKFRQRCRNAFSQIDVQLTRRHNLVPRLVSTVQGAMQHERQTLEAITRTRAEAEQTLRQLSPGLARGDGLMRLSRVENALFALLMTLTARIEAYPELKAMRNTLDLMEELRSTENRIAFARQAYNDAVASFNSLRDSFPTLLLAGILGFSQEQFLELASGV